MVWKAWEHTDGSVWWQLDDVFKALDICQGNELMCDWLRRRLPSFDNAWGDAGMVKECAYRPSQKSQDANAKFAGKPVAGEASLHQSHTMSTKGLLVFLRHCTIYLRGGSKARAIAVLSCWLQLMLPASAAGAIGPAIQSHAQHCGSDAQDGICHHLRHCNELAAKRPTPQATACEFTHQLQLLTHVRLAAKACYAAVVEALASQINANWQQVALTTDPLTGARAGMDGAQPRPKQDEDYKRHIVEETLASKRARTGRQAVQADGLAHPSAAARWNDMATLLRQSAAFQHFKTAQTLSIIGDASRIGNPAENVEVMAAWSPEVGAAVWLPPQASY